MDNAYDKIPYSAADAAIRERIAGTLAHTPAVLRDMMDSLAGAQGKNIRGRLTVLAACDADGLADRTAVDIAAAIELLHLASLVHDDVIDDADTRRGLPSLQSRFGKKKAVMAGDFLFTLCFSLISDAYSRRESAEYIDRIGDFSKVIGLLCLGEIRQYEHNFDLDLDFRNYLRIIGGKTASLFALSMYAGARSADMPHDQARIFGRIGGYMGIIFQLIDDCLDYDGDSATVEKPIGKDLREGIITLPFIYTLRRQPQLRAAFAAGMPSDTMITDIILQVRAAGGVDQTKALAAKYHKKTLKLIAGISDPFKRDTLTSLLDRIYDRQK